MFRLLTLVVLLTLNIQGVKPYLSDDSQSAVTAKSPCSGPDRGQNKFLQAPQPVQAGSEPRPQLELVAQDQTLDSLLNSHFGDMLAVGASRISPDSITGDFNGDGSEDIAIAVHLAKQLQKSDSTPINFLFYKPMGGSRPYKMSSADYFSKLGDLARYRDYPLVVVVHSFRGSGLSQSKSPKVVLADGWDGGKSIILNMSRYRGPLRRLAIGDSPVEPAPVLRGDAILFLDEPERVDGTVVYWDGRQYRWYLIEEFGAKYK
jgi:hypothetical protein